MGEPRKEDIEAGRVLPWSAYEDGRLVYRLPLVTHSDYSHLFDSDCKSVDAEFVDKAYQRFENVRWAVADFWRDRKRLSSSNEAIENWNRMVHGIYNVTKKEITRFDLGDRVVTMFDDEDWTVISRRAPDSDRRSVGVLMGSEMHEIGSSALERNRAVARLLASVPGLYREARKARAFVDKMLKEHPVPDDIREGLEDLSKGLDRAIRKAEGPQVDSQEKEE